MTKPVTTSPIPGVQRSLPESGQISSFEPNSIQEGTHVLRTRSLPLAAVLLLLAASGRGDSGHGPVFGLTTPTNVKRGWTLDLGIMARSGVNDQGIMSRAMLTRGFTEDVQFSLTIPVVFSSAPLAPGRVTGMMSASSDIEGIGAWRFHRRGTGVGKRFESTAYAGFIAAGPQRPRGMLGQLARAPGFYAAVSTGMASRSHYLWVGAGNAHYIKRSNDQRPNLFIYSGVWGYRPPALRKEYPEWDWRVMAEMTGEVSTKVLLNGARMPATGSHQVFLGPTMLGIYKNYAIEGGMQFPVYRDAGVMFQRERFRYTINFSYFF